MEQSIEEGNRLIAEFGGWNKITTPLKEILYTYNFGGELCELLEKESRKYFPKSMKYYYCISENLKYHTSWDWLMPCWIKFVEWYHEVGRKGIYHPSRKLRSEFADASAKGDLKECWNILITGILWYNSKTTKQ